MPQPPLTDDEIGVLRRMIRDYSQDQIVSAWIGKRWRLLAGFIGLVASIAVTTAAIETLIRSGLGG